MSSTDHFEYVKTKKDESVFIITLYNPPANALNLQMLGEISSAIKLGNEDPSTRGLVITGAGNNAFCAGADLKMMQSFSPEDTTKIVETGHRTFFDVQDSVKPVLAAINGLTLG